MLSHPSQALGWSLFQAGLMYLHLASSTLGQDCPLGRIAGEMEEAGRLAPQESALPARSV